MFMEWDTSPEKRMFKTTNNCKHKLEPCRHRLIAANEQETLQVSKLAP